MTKARAKKSEDLVEEAFSAAGFETWTPPKAKFRSQDIFGLFDLAAFHPERGTLWLVQVKTNTVRSINEWFDDARRYEAIESVRTAYVVVHADEGCRMALATPGGYQWAVDGRETDTAVADRVTEYLRGETA